MLPFRSSRRSLPRLSDSRTEWPSVTRRTVLGNIFRAHAGIFLLAVLCLAANTIIGYLVPLLVTTTLDYGIAVAPHPPDGLLSWILRALGGSEFLHSHLYIMVVAMGVAGAVLAFFAFMKALLHASMGERIAAYLKDQLFHHLNRLPLSSQSSLPPTMETLQLCTSSVDAVRTLFRSHLVEALQSIFYIAAAIPLMLALDDRLAMISFLFLAAILIQNHIEYRAVKRACAEEMQSEANLVNNIHERIGGIQTIKAFARQESEVERFSQACSSRAAAANRRTHFVYKQRAVIDLLCLLQVTTILLVGAFWLTRGSLTLGVMWAFISYTGMIAWPIRQLGAFSTQLAETLVGLGQIARVLSLRPEDDAGMSAAARLNGDLVFENVTVLSSTRQHTIQGVSFSVRRGEVLGIIGLSGAGKSTLMKCLIGYEELASGVIKIDGTNMREISLASLRRQIGFVFQDPYLCSRTIREIVTSGKPDATDEEIATALRDAHIEEWVDSCPGKYEYLIHESGRNMSGGQRQRLALAAVLLKDPPVLVLDDALSAIDGETEKMILGVIDARRGDRSTIIVSSRPSALRICDKILLLDRGRVAQWGTPEELKRADGLYQTVWATSAVN